MKILILLCFLSVGSLASATETEVLDSKISLSFTGCNQISQAEGKFSYDKACVMAFYDNHQAVKTTFPLWQKSIQKPVTERLIEPNEEFLQYLILDNLLWDSPKYENIRPVKDKTLIKAAKKALAGLPPELNQYISERFYGFVVVSGIGWSGLAPGIIAQPENSLKTGAVIVLNADFINNLNLNDWLAFKENTAFQFPTADASGYPKVELSMNYSIPGKKSTLADNLRNLLIHETAHMIAAARPDIHPDFKYRNGKPVPLSEFQKWAVPQKAVTEAFPFVNAAWGFEETQMPEGGVAYTPRQKIATSALDIIKQKRVRFYGEDPTKKYTLDEATVIYNELNQTCFSSLYAMVDFTEDFAETVNHYFMTKYGYEYSIKLTLKKAKGEKRITLAQFKDLSGSKPECQSKIDLMKELFE